ncbi:uncharacterized protein LOC134658521 [Cydia amplana]|uniref:uncharacterized protein LOC134658521 n=1 Tax=Cydia amplana TaxID=1869771 RepID=UPI002FE6757C
MAPIKCARCDKAPTSKDILVCSACKLTYDIECASVTYARWNLMNPKQRTSWKCSTCCEQALQASKDNNSSVTTRAKTNRPANEAQSDGPARLNEAPVYSEDQMSTLISEIRLLRADIHTIREEMTQFREEMRTEIASCKTNVTKVEQRVNNIEERLLELEGCRSQTIELKATIECLKTEMNDKEQDMLINDVEIVGIPESSGESIEHMICLLATKIGTTLAVTDIAEAYRSGPRRIEASGAQPALPRPIVVRFVRRAVKERVLRAARVRRNMSTTDLELPGKAKSVYMNERLTRENRRIFKKAREEASKRSWKYVWTRFGRIEKQAEGRQAHRLRNDEDFSKVFMDSQLDTEMS